MKKLNKQEFIQITDANLSRIKSIIEKKNNDYAGGKVETDPFKNFRESEDFGVKPLIGLSIRMGDKFQRLKTFCKEGQLKVDNEGIEDVFFDMIGYSLLALGMIEEGKRNNLP